MSETTTETIPLASTDLYPCCDPKTCPGCGCCADDKGKGAPCC